MSADEIKKLTDLSTPIMPEHFQATVMWPKQWDEIKAALLDYAAMVERCEEIKVEQPFDTVINTANYILKGKTDERK